MKKNWQIKAFLLVLAATMLACQTVMGVPEYEDDIYEDDIAEASPQESDSEDAPPPAQPEVERPVNDDGEESCMVDESYHPENSLCYSDNGTSAEAFFSLMASATEYDEDFEEKLLDSEYVLVKYEIDGNEIFSPEYEDVDSDLLDEQDNTALHQQIWDFYAAMIPAEDRDFVSHYVIMTDGLGGTLAAVEQNPEAPTLWMLSVDISDTDNLAELTFTLIHEYGHLLTLNTSQVNIDEYIFNNPDDEDAYADAEYNCETYFTGEGCAKSSSYFYLFFDEFWSGFYDEWSEIQYIEDDDAYYDATDDFYYKYEDHFVTDYAATNPGEDIAESWAFFVTKAKPTGNTIADKKVLFFYEFPELVALRDEIIARGYSRLIRMQ
ncbi:MAG: hypothetical protein GY755_18045 [Chloroflexi bacterium]|nr:hypothetical protein [Chloroflexota bacterium]